MGLKPSVATNITQFSNNMGNANVQNAPIHQMQPWKLLDLHQNLK